MMEFINLPVLKNPLNWLTVFMMIFIVVMGFDVLFRHHDKLKTMADPAQ